MEDNKKAIKILENSIKEKGWEVKWIRINKGIEYMARKENYDICTRSHLAEGDIYQEELGRLIALTRLFKVVYKFEGEVFFGKNKQSGFVRTWLAGEVMEVLGRWENE